VPHRLIDRIREKIRLKEYDMTIHAMEEMAEDDLDVLDIDEAVLNGRVVRINKDDRRGTRLSRAWRLMVKSWQRSLVAFTVLPAS
jgi:hypothetical protein